MIFAITFGAVCAWMLVAWIISLIRKDASIVDPFWGPGFLVATITAFFASGGETSFRRVFLLSLVAIWALRLGIYLLRRNLAEGEEDYRYRQMREKWGEKFPWVSLGTVFLLQAALCWFIALPLIKVQSHPGPDTWTLLDIAGLTLWICGLFFEAVGDFQLSRFKADPSHRGKVLDTGLWRYTRHPNYFGDFLVWWGFFLVALNSPGGWMTVASPVLMSIFLMRVSGVTLLEKKLSETRSGYREYKQRTNAFFPGPRKEL